MSVQIKRRGRDQVEADLPLSWAAESGASIPRAKGTMSSGGDESWVVWSHREQ